MKPNGLRIGYGPGGLALSVTTPDRVSDAIWSAVQAAIESGLTVRQFRVEAAQAWDHELTEARKDAAKDWSADAQS